MNKLTIVALFVFAPLAHANTVTVPGSGLIINVPDGCALTGKLPDPVPAVLSLTGCVGGVVPPVPPIIPPSGVSCAGFNKTVVIKIDWNSGSDQRLFTSTEGAFGPNDAVVVEFTPGSIPTPNNNLARISAGEYGTNPSTRIATLSATPCDWSAQSTYGASSSGTSVTVPFTVANPNNYGYYPILNSNTAYFFNIKNDANSGCTASGACDIFVELVHPAGTLAADTPGVAFTQRAAAYAKAAKAAPKAAATQKAALALQAAATAEGRAEGVKARAK